MTLKEGTVEIEGIGHVRLRLAPSEEELIQAERAKRARGFFLALIESLLIEPSYVREDWVRLPEEALRPLALTIADANGLLPFFRPKREKQFYNAFRNAWRMKRSSHNEAIFQRAIATWKSYLARGLSVAAAAYRKGAGDKSKAIGCLARAGFVLSPTSLAKVTRHVENLEKDELGAYLEDLWSDEDLEKLVDHWFDLEPFRRREKIIQDAFSAYCRGEYSLAIYGLFP
ncbi:hypothetical protein KAW44_00355, partial [Candidatus Bipolaricaulota bacterium]|nr:hypothetical protein [Candidatus Bipolaricaulota bacterium]